jgi:hypothetical protein
MSISSVVIVAAVVCIASSSAQAQSIKLPPEVTPAIRAACETDVRRLCIGTNPTVAKVKSCVIRRYRELSSRCQIHLAAAGLGLGR